jgi:hypothetical protein
MAATTLSTGPVASMTLRAMLGLKWVKAALGLTWGGGP